MMVVELDEWRNRMAGRCCSAKDKVPHTLNPTTQASSGRDVLEKHIYFFFQSVSSSSLSHPPPFPSPNSP